MRNTVEIENIAELRRREGIEDVELQEEIERLQVGEHVKLTFLTASKTFAGETLLVRITHIAGMAFRGKLVHQPACPDLIGLRPNSLITFTADHIHSIAKPRAKRSSASD